MKRNITKIFAALALLVFMAPSMMMWGQVTWTASEQGYTNAQDVTAFTVDNHVSGEFAKGTGTNAPKYYTSGTSVRMYNGNTLTLTPAANYQITKIEFAFNQNGGFTVSSGNYTNATWTGTTTSGVTFTNGSSQNRIQAITVTYSETGGPQPTTYTVTYNANVTGVSPIVDTYNEGADVTLRAANTFTNEGYTFDEWNTQADGDGDGYVAGDVIEDIQEDIELYAMWTENTTPTPGGDNITFDFEDDGAHRSNTSNNYTSQNTYSENGATITLMYADAVTTGTPLNGSANILGRIAKNTTNSPTIHIGSIDITNKTITKIEYDTKGVGAMSQVFEYSLDNSNWTNLLTLSSMPTSAATETVDDLSITGTNLYLRWTTTVSATTGSNRDFQLDDIVITYTTSSNPVPTISASNVDIAFDATSGSIGYTINNEPNPAGTMTAAIVEGSTIANLSLGTIVNGTVPFTCDANTTVTERTATVTLTYTYNRETTTQTVTVTQAGNPNIVDNISDITGAGTYAVRGTIVAINQRGFILGDGTGYVYYYYGNSFNHGDYAIGDIKKISGTVSVNSGNKIIQFGSGATIETATSSNYVAEDPTILSGSDMDTRVGSSTATLSSYVQYEGKLSVSGTYYNITDINGATTAKGSISFPLNTDFTSLNGKQVKVTGYFVGVSSNMYYNTTLGSIEEVVGDVETPTFSPAAGTYTETQTVAISCATANSTIYYTLDGTEPTNSSTQYTGALTISATTTVKAIAYVGTNNSMVATATYHFCSADDPYTVTEALAFNEYPANGIFVTGIVSTAPTSLSSGTLTYFISVDGEATNELEVYKGKNLENASFTAVDDIQVGDIVTVYGNVVIYGTTNPIKEFASGNYLVSFERPVAPAQEYTLTVGNPAHVTFTVGYGTDGVLTNGENDDIEEGTEITLTVNVEAGYLLGGITVTGENSQSVTVTETSTQGVYTFNMPAFNATISATTIVAPATTTYTLATSIESGKQYIIVGQDEGVYYAMGSDRGNNRSGVIITISGTTATATVENNAVHEFTITSLGTENHYSIMDATTSGGYLYAASSSNNYLKTESALDNEGNGDWEITIDAGVFSVVASGNYTHKYMRFNNAQDLFSCYEQGKQHPVFLYQKVEPQTYTLTIDGYTDVTEGTNNMGYYLIASPVTVDPAEVDGMTEDNFDLYYFKQNPEIDPETGIGLEWINYKETAANGGGFDLVPGKGYLYAKKATNENPTYSFELTGMPYTGDGSIELVKDTESQWAGWNLIGNPFGVTANFSVTRDFYVMNTNGNEIIAAEDPDIAPMQGVFVIAEEDGESVTFVEAVATPGIDDKKVVLNVSRNRGDVIDRAIVRFGEGRQLPKFQLNQNNAKVYIAEGNQDYAVVRSAYEGEMPVSFKAENNGTYTISTNAENVEMTYLHLIDNLTGADVDMLATPSYTFDARTTDYASRFKLVFKASTGIDENTTTTFAYFNGSEWTVSNQGNATLQVIDMTGRVLSNTQINGNATININETAGIYMLRLVNGDNTMIQKIVVR